RHQNLTTTPEDMASWPHGPGRPDRAHPTGTALLPAPTTPARTHTGPPRPPRHPPPHHPDPGWTPARDRPTVCRPHPRVPPTPPRTLPGHPRLHPRPAPGHPHRPPTLFAGCAPGHPGPPPTPTGPGHHLRQRPRRPVPAPTGQHRTTHPAHPRPRPAVPAQPAHRAPRT